VAGGQSEGTQPPAMGGQYLLNVKKKKPLMKKKNRGDKKKGSGRAMKGEERGEQNETDEPDTAVTKQPDGKLEPGDQEKGFARKKSRGRKRKVTCNLKRRC